MNDFMNSIPQDFINFILVTIFSLLIGLEQKKLHHKRDNDELFGTDRTFALTGILGFILYLLNQQNYIPFLIGFIVMALLLSIFYHFKLNKEKSAGFTSIIAILITYTIAPIIYTQPHWLMLLIIIGVLILLEIKKDLLKFSKRIKHRDFITLAKFLIIAGVVLPLLPQKSLFTFVSISPYKFWLAIVAVSSISYISYLLQKYVFPEAGLLLTGLLGGLYSSTATTIVLARKSKSTASTCKIVAGILIATAMMYARLLILAFIFNRQIAKGLLPYFIPLIVISLLFGFYFNSKEQTNIKHAFGKNKNPLEFKTALIFGFLFIAFAVITELALKYYGNTGVKILSLIVGVTDIDPFILNLFQSKLDVLTLEIIISSTVIATTSNAFIKMIYALTIGTNTYRKPIIISFSGLIIASVLLLLIL
ncbi:MAG: MgtC/SapB family protein [Lutibacter sp.]